MLEKTSDPLLPPMRQIIISMLLTFLASANIANADQESFATDIRPILAAKCFRCHGPDEQNAKVRLDNLSVDLVEQSLGAETWHDALNAIRRGDMPPEDEAKLSKDQRRVLTEWISSELDRLRKSRRSGGGQVVMRRLNRVEYQNTMTDLLGVELDYARNLPPDPLSQDGFQNNGAALRMSGMQLEYYLQADRDGLRRAIDEGPAPEVFTHEATDTVSDKGKGNFTNRLGRTGMFVARIPEFPDEGEFVLQVKAHAEIPDGAMTPAMQVRLGFRADVSAPAKLVGIVDVPNTESKIFEFRTRFEEFPIQSRTQSKYPGMLVWIDNAYADGKADPKPKQVKDALNSKKKRTRTVWEEDPTFPKIVIESLSFTAPVYTSWPPRHHTSIVVRQPTAADEEWGVVRDSLQSFIHRAFRRPATSEDVDTSLAYYDKVRTSAASFEAAMRETIAMLLVSPDFLYLAEPKVDSRLDTDSISGSGRKASATLDHFRLAPRLSYFLWSTMPDDELLQCAESGSLSDEPTLAEQVKRMLADKRSSMFTTQFSEQWLDLAGVDRVAVNPEFYPAFDNRLKAFLRQETSEFFAEILRSDESALRLLDADFTMLNEPLARHYGIDGPRGLVFERVRLPENETRGGVLGHGSILLANSTGDDSHPIKRAVWIRDRLLDDPPAPPPPDVPDLKQDLPEIAALPLKEQLKLHLENDACADCHRELDPWGVALDAFDAVGLKREVIRRRNPKKRGKFVEHTVDTVTTLPVGKEVDGLAELKAYLVNKKNQEFARTLVVKLLTYALGRSLQFTDDELVDDLTARFVKSEYKLKPLIFEICNSSAFRN